MTIKVLEKDVQRSILDFLKLKRLLAIRINSGGFPINRKDGSKGWARGADAGTADILAFTGASVIWVECKSSVGKLTESQKEFKKKVEKLGHIYIVARSLDDVMGLFNQKPSRWDGADGF